VRFCYNRCIVGNYRGALILDRLEISTKEVVVYLESINVINEQILAVLRKKPALPDYECLPWFVDFNMDKVITRKLKSNKKLSGLEIDKLRQTLLDALTMLRRGPGRNCAGEKAVGLQNYIENL